MVVTAKANTMSWPYRYDAPLLPSHTFLTARSTCYKRTNDALKSSTESCSGRAFPLRSLSPRCSPLIGHVGLFRLLDTDRDDKASRHKFVLTKHTPARRRVKYSSMMCNDHI